MIFFFLGGGQGKGGNYFIVAGGDAKSFAHAKEP